MESIAGVLQQYPNCAPSSSTEFLLFSTIAKTLLAYNHVHDPYHAIRARLDIIAFTEQDIMPKATNERQKRILPIRSKLSTIALQFLLLHSKRIGEKPHFFNTGLRTCDNFVR